MVYGSIADWILYDVSCMCHACVHVSAIPWQERQHCTGHGRQRLSPCHPPGPRPAQRGSATKGGSQGEAQRLRAQLVGPGECWAPQGQWTRYTALTGKAPGFGLFKPAWKGQAGKGDEFEEAFRKFEEQVDLDSYFRCDGDSF